MQFEIESLFLFIWQEKLETENSCILLSIKSQSCTIFTFKGLNKTEGERNNLHGNEIICFTYFAFKSQVRATKNANNLTFFLRDVSTFILYPNS